jgi:hypothetical protein
LQDLVEDFLSSRGASFFYESGELVDGFRLLFSDNLQYGFAEVLVFRLTCQSGCAF